MCRIEPIIKQAVFFFPVHVEDIILHMFQYIQKLRTEGPQEWVFQECKVQWLLLEITSGSVFTIYWMVKRIRTLAMEIGLLIAWWISFKILKVCFLWHDANGKYTENTSSV